ncbi:MAG: VCBS repeat-containing protein, partial [Aureliella sp.]
MQKVNEQSTESVTTHATKELSNESVIPESIHFVNVAEQAGFDTVVYCGGENKNHILESTGSGCAWLDYDEDGLIDAFVLNAWQLDNANHSVKYKGRSKLFRNMGTGRFSDESDPSGLSADDWSCGVCAGDFNNDGHVDLYVTNFGTNRLYQNLGQGKFVDVALDAGVQSSGWSTGAAFFDADNDGWLDLYVAKYIDCDWDDVLNAERTSEWQGSKVMAGPFGMRGGQDRFYKNNRDGTFSDSTEVAGMADTAESYGLGVLASDLDADGDVDIFVANDSNPNFVYRNDGNGTFKETGGWSGAGYSGDGRPQGSMGVDAGDFTGDGLQDLLVTNFAQDYSTLYKNESELFFSDISSALRMSEFTRRTLSWGCALGDYDCDGQLEILILNGHIYPQVDAAPSTGETYRQLPTLLRKTAGKLVDVSRHAGPGMQQAESMRGLAVADYDEDGKLDLLVTAIDSQPLLLHNESLLNHHWLGVRVL